MSGGEEGSWTGWAVALGGLTLATFLAMTTGIAVGPLPPWVPWLVAVGIGALGLLVVRRAAAQRRHYRARLQAAAVAEAVQRERLAIAGELHDVASHGLGAITLRARAGQRGDADDARAALADVAALSRAATDDLRQLLTLLRDPAGQPPTEPTPRLADAASLVDAARSRGLDVRAVGLDITDTPGRELAAYHVVREALHNVERHAGATRVDVRVHRLGDALVVDVIDEGPRGPRRPVPGFGHGLQLLSQRLRAAGGDLRHGPAGAGYGVSARIGGDDA